MSNKYLSTKLSRTNMSYSILKKQESELADIQRAVVKVTNAADKQVMYDEIRERVNAIAFLRRQLNRPAAPAKKKRVSPPSVSPPELVHLITNPLANH